MFPHQTTIQALELQVNEISIDLMQEQRISNALGELVEDQCDLIETLRNKIMALEAIIAEDAKPQEPNRRKLEDSERVRIGDIVVKYGRDDYTIRSAMPEWTANLFTLYLGCEVWRPL